MGVHLFIYLMSRRISALIARYRQQSKSFLLNRLKGQNKVLTDDIVVFITKIYEEIPYR